LNGYDMVLFACQGAQSNQASASQQNLIDFADAGGWVFAEYFGYVWLYDDAPSLGAARGLPIRTI
jgi:hypothetical protein